MFFKDVIGQNHIKQKLINGVKEGRIAHAQLFYGKSGTGSLPMALAYAQYIQCEAPTETDSCGVCSACQKNMKLTHPDVHFVFPIINKKKAPNNSVCDDYIRQFREIVTANPYFLFEEWQDELPEKKRPVIYTAEGDEIIRKLGLKAFEAKTKIMIIWCADVMHENCANKILKTLEEPQGQTVFILITDRIEALLPTIVSRTQHLLFPPIEDELLVEQLYRLNIRDENVPFYIKNARGSYNELLKAIDENDTRVYHFKFFELFMRLAWVFAKGDFMDYKLLVEDFAQMNRSSQIALLQYFQQEIRENYIYNFKNETIICLSKLERGFSQKFAKFVNESNIEDLMKEISLAQAQIEQNVNSKFIMLDLLLKTSELLTRKPV